MSVVCAAANLALVLSFFSAQTFGWNSRGHKIVAAVAFQELEKNNPEAIEEIVKLLQSHPAFPIWTNEYKNAKPDVKKAYSLNAYYFMRAAIWSDDVRSPEGNPEHRPTWHFVNYPLSLPNSIDFDTVNPKINIFVGFTNSMSDVKKTSLQKKRKAIALSWIFHLVGDVHQPLHSAALVNDDFPKGDSGGNSLCLKPGKGAFINNLHSYWDGLMGETKSDLYDGMHAWRDALFFSKITKDINPSQFTAEPEIEDWAKESAKLALSNAYNFNGTPIKLFKKITITERNGKKRFECPENIPDEDIVPSDYNSDAQDIAVRRLLTAGYRLANVLKSITD